jgi:formate hydrogenlyase subunit 3/multisubunit Na+/H+ antiporter MnhD subunit
MPTLPGGHIVRNNMRVRICCNIIWTITIVLSTGAVLLSTLLLHYITMYNYEISTSNNVTISGYKEYIDSISIVMLIITLLLTALITALSPECMRM